METLKEVPRLAASTYSHTTVTPAEKPLREQRGNQELIAWIGIAVIWSISALAILVVWIRISRGA